MKKIYLLLLTVAGLTAGAQSTFLLNNFSTGATLAPNTVINATTTPLMQTKITLDIKNTTTVRQVYDVKRYDILLNTVTADASQALAYFCFAGSCYGPPTMMSPTSLTLQAGKKASDTTAVDSMAAYYTLAADLDEASQVGCSEVRYTFFNTLNPSDSAQIVMKYSCTTTAIKERSKQTSFIDVFPNPAKDLVTVTINSTKTTRSTMTVINSIGALIAVDEVTLQPGANRIPLNVSSYESGLYFIRMDDGSHTITKRMIVN
jgi:hypothetical protein